MAVQISRFIFGASAGPPGPSGPTGPAGPQGPSGTGFQIAKTYPSQAALLSDTNPSGILVGEFGIVSSANPDTSDLYLWQGVGPGWLFIVQLSSGAIIPGPPGPQGPSGPTGPLSVVGPSLMAFIGYIDATAGLSVGI